ncbi:uncharacterized protein UV8b_06576 [Ustilaginoidea virens]|uniref:Mitochondrial import inner membrane translocase subunit tim23 n=1 Tax=Ustilaginoidea virens TaxID=1159556 RepID=A0A1B5KVX9_USTVR|nr:uncharacterized protein UV8b_06576 [Ustilaginoidea virens]QUC22335.1 hypothetical protein UV8b_06576 [Ustilaginoidea virens]GAO14165.1 hypothetical protein UVI_02037520 [Ustilaginoidea virens]
MSSLWNAFTSGNKPRHEHRPEQAHAVHSTPSPATPATPATSSTDSFDPSLGQGVEAFLHSSTFSDPSQLHPLAGLNKDTLEYLSLEDSALSELPGGQSVLPSRGFTDDLCYGTGITYLAALSIGGAWGLKDGLQKSVGQPPKLRMNAILNGMTRRGPFLGNSAGVVAIVYNCVNSLIGSLRGKHDAANSVVAGVLSGMVFKSTRGARSMMISGGVVGSVAGIWAIARRAFFPLPETAASIENL